MRVEVVERGAAETISAGPVTIRILEDGTHTHHRLGLVELTIPPGTEGPPQHIHYEHDETFFVISGTPTFACGDQTIPARPGTLVTAMPGTPHTFANPGEQAVVMLCTVTPDRYIGFFRELAALRPGPNGLEPHAVAQVMAHYATEVPRPTASD
jgi:mannose-6-phosphate isomerase-like protein (cupin superfamily)